MGITLLVHILAGLLALAAGYPALLAAKGARLHRKSGMVFVCAMAVMGVTATVIAAVRGLEATMFGGVLPRRGCRSRSRTVLSTTGRSSGGRSKHSSRGHDDERSRDQ